MKRFVTAVVAALIASTGLIAAAPGPASAAAPGLFVDASLDRHAISDGIYGMNSYLTDPGLAAELRLPVERFGGDSTTTFNSQIDAENEAANYWWGNYPAGTSPDGLVFENQRVGTGSLITVPTLGWLAKAKTGCSYSIKKYGPQGVRLAEQQAPEPSSLEQRPRSRLATLGHSSRNPTRVSAHSRRVGFRARSGGSGRGRHGQRSERAP